MPRAPWNERNSPSSNCRLRFEYTSHRSSSHLPAILHHHSLVEVIRQRRSTTAPTSPGICDVYPRLKIFLNLRGASLFGISKIRPLSGPIHCGRTHGHKFIPQSNSAFTSPLTINDTYHTTTFFFVYFSAWACTDSVLLTSGNM